MMVSYTINKLKSSEKTFFGIVSQDCSHLSKGQDSPIILAPGSVTDKSSSFVPEW